METVLRHSMLGVRYSVFKTSLSINNKTNNTMRPSIGILLLVAMLTFSCGSEEEVVPSGTPNDMVMDMTPSGQDKQGMGVFTGYAHSLSGKAVLLTDGNSNTIRLEDFNMTAGPDVYVFVSKANNYSQSNVIEVAKLTSGYTNSDINLTFSSVEFTSEHKFVLVYCVQFNSLFGYAELK